MKIGDVVEMIGLNDSGPDVEIVGISGNHIWFRPLPVRWEAMPLTTHVTFVREKVKPKKSENKAAAPA